MSGYIEVMIRGNCRAYLKVDQIAGVLTASGATAETLATSEAPMSILLNSGETLEGVYGLTPNRLMLYVEGVKAVLRHSGRVIAVAYLDKAEEFEGLIAQAMGDRHG